jgi:hypothetical protein
MAARTSHPHPDEAAPFTQADDVDGLLSVIKSYQTNNISPIRKFLINMVARLGRTRLIATLLLVALALFILALVIAPTNFEAAIGLVFVAGICFTIAMLLL